jgi:3-hydroxybutyrate dehydrogenase
LKTAGCKAVPSNQPEGTFSVKGKTAIVTGSTSGIGLSIAQALAAGGCNIVLNGLGDAQAIEKERADIESTHGIQCLFHPADMSDEQQIKDMVTAAHARFGRIDILVNNAGIQFTAPVESFPSDRWNAILAINLSAPFHAIAAVLPHMKAQDWGRIINIASVHGLVASANKSAYVAAKHGLIGLTKVVALENAASNITCNAICPGWVRTPLVEAQIDKLSQAQNITREQAATKLLEEKQPSKKFVEASHIAKWVLDLCDDDATSATGMILAVDGGWTAQ